MSEYDYTKMKEHIETSVREVKRLTAEAAKPRELAGNLHEIFKGLRDGLNSNDPEYMKLNMCIILHHMTTMTQKLDFNDYLRENFKILNSKYNEYEE